MATKSVTKAAKNVRPEQAQAIISSAATSPGPQRPPFEARSWRDALREQRGLFGHQSLRLVDRADTGICGIDAIMTILRNQDRIEEENRLQDDIAKLQPTMSPNMVSGLHDAIEILVGVCQHDLEKLRDRMVAGENQ